MRVGTLKTLCASLQATRLVWSLCVTAMIMSASSAPACADRGRRRIADHRAQSSGPATVPGVARRIDDRDVVFFETRPSATLAPTWPAPENDHFHASPRPAFEAGFLFFAAFAQFDIQLFQLAVKMCSLQPGALGQPWSCCPLQGAGGARNRVSRRHRALRAAAGRTRAAGHQLRTATCLLRHHPRTSSA
jgi:hypothetical protein